MSGKSLLDTEPFGVLRSVIEEEVGKYARELKYDIDNHPPRINECWVNVYGRGHSQEIHCHRNSVFSGIYYAKAPPGCGEVVFVSPLSDTMLEPPTTRATMANTFTFEVPPEAGRMVIFRSWLRHGVKPNEIDEDRISIAFNVTM